MLDCNDWFDKIRANHYAVLGGKGRNVMEFEFIKCRKESEFKLARTLVHDYVEWLDIDFSFQNIDEEIEQFDDLYGSNKAGAFLIARDREGELAGGGGFRNFDVSSCEMKRLYVYDKYQGMGVGRGLCERLLALAREMKYFEMKLDTLKRLVSANLLYEKIGFKDIPPYRLNPDPTARYMMIRL